jgi:hypothetical protein
MKVSPEEHAHIHEMAMGALDAVVGYAARIGPSEIDKGHMVSALTWAMMFVLLSDDDQKAAKNIVAEHTIYMAGAVETWENTKKAYEGLLAKMRTKH